MGRRVSVLNFGIFYIFTFYTTFPTRAYQKSVYETHVGSCIKEASNGVHCVDFKTVRDTQLASLLGRKGNFRFR